MLNERHRLGSYFGGISNIYPFALYCNFSFVNLTSAYNFFARQDFKKNFGVHYCKGKHLSYKKTPRIESTFMTSGESLTKYKHYHESHFRGKKSELPRICLFCMGNGFRRPWHLHFGVRNGCLPNFIVFCKHLYLYTYVLV